MSLDNVIVDKRALEFSGDMEEYIKKEISSLRQELRKESAFYYAQRVPQRIENKTVILVDDGISTGKNMEITIDLIKKMQPRKLIIAVPVASKEALQLIRKKVDEAVCVHVPELFITKAHWYTHFDMVDPKQAFQLLSASFCRRTLEMVHLELPIIKLFGSIKNAIGAKIIPIMLAIGGIRAYTERAYNTGPQFLHRLGFPYGSHIFESPASSGSL